MRVLITGADGFVGRHLARHLQERKDQVTAVAGPHGQPPALDVTRKDRVMAMVADHRPDAIIHLAGFSSVARSHADPSTAFEVNLGGTVNLLTAVREHSPKSRLLIVGSGEMYGPVETGRAVREDHALVATSPYAASKIAAEVAALQFHRSYGLEVICARPFNHLGRGQDRTFAIPAFAAQVRSIREGTSEPVIKVGNLEAVRDFSHVDDVVAAYRLLLERGESGGIYNVSSGEGRTLRSLLDELISLGEIEARVEVDPTRLRPSDVPYLVGDSARLRALGWAPASSVTWALKDVLGDAA